MSYSPLELNGKVAVVVGGTSGIGRAIAHGMAEAGADVIPTSRRMEQVEAAAAEIEERGRRSLRLASDVSDRASLERVLAETVKAFGKVDILVNSAGRTKRASTLDFSEEDWNDIMETNLTGTLRACQVFGRHMLEREYGRIINIASLSTFVALYEVAAYAASKAAVASLTKSLAVEWSPRGVNVNAIAPGRVPAAHAYEAFRAGRRTGGSGSLSGFGRCKLCRGRNSDGGRWLPRQRG
jgi:NAD(P)-dependent dehydrogenase (short-subunit alcohol dehydrogenase family)